MAATGVHTNEARQTGRLATRAETAQRVLLLCGLMSSLLYVGTDALGAIRYPCYSYTSQAISELGAIGSPVASLLMPLFLTYDVLLIAFGVGVLREAVDRNRALRVAGALLTAIGVIGLFWLPFFPMHARGAGTTLTDTMHIVLSAVTVLLILLAIGFGARAFGKGFRRYSIATILILVAAGALAGRDGARLAAQLPTPWLGVTERINVFGYLLWVAVLAVLLLRSRSHRADA